MTAAVRVVLFGAGLVALGLARQLATASTAPMAPVPPDLATERSGGELESSRELFDARSAGLGLKAVPSDQGPIDETDTGEDAAETGGREPPAVAGSRDSRWTATDVLYMRERATPRARCIIDREIGGFGYDPWRRGAAGERGPVQLHPRGLLPEFLTWSGGQAPENPYYAIPFLEYKLRQGQGRAWSPVRLGLC